MLKSLRVRTADLAAALLFSRDALSLPVVAGGALQGFAAVREGAGCELALHAGAAPAAAPAAALRYPFLTYGVSNLRTSARHARRHGGAAVLPAAGAEEASFALPGAAAGVRLLHLFRRNPAVSVTLGVADPEAGARFFCAALGMRQLEGEEAALACPRAGRPSRVLAALGAQPHNTSSLVLEAWQGSSNEGAGVDEEAALTLATADATAALRACHQRGLLTSTPSASGSFVALLEGGYSLHVIQEQQQAGV